MTCRKTHKIRNTDRAKLTYTQSAARVIHRSWIERPVCEVMQLAMIPLVAKNERIQNDWMTLVFMTSAQLSQTIIRPGLSLL